MVKYDLYFGSVENPPMVMSDIPDSVYTLDLLDRNTTYYWKVVVKDDKGAKVTGVLWHFKVNDL